MITTKHALFLPTLIAICLIRDVVSPQVQGGKSVSKSNARLLDISSNTNTDKTVQKLSPSSSDTGKSFSATNGNDAQEYFSKINPETPVLLTDQSPKGGPKKLLTRRISIGSPSMKKETPPNQSGSCCGRGAKAFRLVLDGLGNIIRLCMPCIPRKKKQKKEEKELGELLSDSQYPSYKRQESVNESKDSKPPETVKLIDSHNPIIDIKSKNEKYNSLNVIDDAPSSNALKSEPHTTNTSPEPGKLEKIEDEKKDKMNEVVSQTNNGESEPQIKVQENDVANPSSPKVVQPELQPTKTGSEPGIPKEIKNDETPKIIEPEPEKKVLQNEVENLSSPKVVQTELPLTESGHELGKLKEIENDETPKIIEPEPEIKVQENDVANPSSPKVVQPELQPTKTGSEPGIPKEIKNDETPKIIEPEPEKKVLQNEVENLSSPKVVQTELPLTESGHELGKLKEIENDETPKIIEPEPEIKVQQNDVANPSSQHIVQTELSRIETDIEPDRPKAIESEDKTKTDELKPEKNVLQNDAANSSSSNVVQSELHPTNVDPDPPVITEDSTPQISDTLVDNNSVTNQIDPRADSKLSHDTVTSISDPAVSQPLLTSVDPDCPVITEDPTSHGISKESEPRENVSGIDNIDEIADRRSEAIKDDVAEATSPLDPVKSDPLQTTNILEQEGQKKDESKEKDKFKEITAVQEKHDGSDAEKEQTPEATSSSDPPKPEPHPTVASPKPPVIPEVRRPIRSGTIALDISEKSNSMDAVTRCIQEHSPDFIETTISPDPFMSSTRPTAKPQTTPEITDAYWRSAINAKPFGYQFAPGVHWNLLQEPNPPRLEPKVESAMDKFKAGLMLPRENLKDQPFSKYKAQLEETMLTLREGRAYYRPKFNYTIESDQKKLEIQNDENEFKTKEFEQLVVARNEYEEVIKTSVRFSR